MKERDKLKKQGRFEEYRVLHNIVTSLIRDSKSASYKNKIEDGKDDPKSIWKIFKEFGTSSKKNDDNNILGLRINDKIVSDNSESAGIFNDYLINIAANLKEPLENTDLSKLKSFICNKIPDDVNFELPNIDENFIFGFLSTLDTSKATGLDDVGPRLLKLSSGIITKSLTAIVNKCLANGSFPTIWKQAKVSPLYKGGAKEELNCYRPISILPTLSKLLENFIHKHLMAYLDTFDLIHKSQSGFLVCCLAHRGPTGVFLLLRS